jgi:hypothetical protein
MVFVSFPMIFSVVRSLRTVICVKRQNKNCSSPAFSNQDVAVSECTCRLHKSASQTFASRKFNVFINLFAGQVYLWAFGNDEREPHPLGTRTLTLQEYASDPRENELTDGVASRSSLFF